MTVGKTVIEYPSVYIGPTSLMEQMIPCPILETPSHIPNAPIAVECEEEIIEEQVPSQHSNPFSPFGRMALGEEEGQIIEHPESLTNEDM